MSERSEIQESTGRNGNRSYEVVIRHRSLSRCQTVRGDNPWIVLERANARMAQWDATWARREATQARRSYQQGCKDQARRRTEVATGTMAGLERLLADSIEPARRFRWDVLLPEREFDVPRPARPRMPEPPGRASLPRAPEADDPEYTTTRGWMDWLLPERYRVRCRSLRQQHARDLAAWEDGRAAAEDAFEQALARHEERCLELDAHHEEALDGWRAARDAFAQHEARRKQSLEDRRSAWLEARPAGIEDYCGEVLRHARPECLPVEPMQIQYRPLARTLVVELGLPAPDGIPSLLDVRYVQSRDAFVERSLPRRRLHALYDGVVAQLVLASINELFRADDINALDAVALNGRVHAIDPATGRAGNRCTLSVVADRASFEGLELAAVDPEACLRGLGCRAGTKLHKLEEVSPAFQLAAQTGSQSRGRRAGSGLRPARLRGGELPSVLETMLQRAFTRPGAEVRVTRDDHGGSVTARVSDPDPLQGGRIVVRASTAERPVSLSAARDLFGAILVEGANKGILVSTTDFEPEVYEFTRGKPITLLDGRTLERMSRS